MSQKALKTRVLEWFAKAGGRVADGPELVKSLKIPAEGKSDLKAALRDLISAGKLQEGRGGRFRLAGGKPSAQPSAKPVKTAAPKGSQLSGRLLARAGGVFFLPDLLDEANAAVCAPLGITKETKETKLPVNPERMATALPGDTVTVTISAADGQRGGRERSRSHFAIRVTDISERRHATLPGTLHVKGQQAWVEADDLFLPGVEVKPGGRVTAKHGDKVVVAIDDWTPRGKRLRGHIVKRLGVTGDPGVDVLGIIAKHGLAQEFPREVLREAEANSDIIPAAEIARREDWRGRHVITIDPFDAKDFDDAICVTELPHGAWELAVHIADVSHYVRPGTALDAEALRRGNSTYLVDRVIPMLPERLSNGLCSLRPGEDKLTRAAILTFDAKGRRTGQRFVKAKYFAFSPPPFKLTV